jgi:hypothetical protein
MVEFDDEWASASQWAAMYRAHGLQVVPAHDPREGGQWKRPFGDWIEFQDALAPDAVFARWWDPATGEHRLRKNMGIITGAASGGLVVVDLDRKEGSQAFQWWADLLAEHCHGQEPVTWIQRTGGGGRQLLFRAPVGWVPPTFKAPSMCVDVRGQGGFIMAPPSRHSSGEIYDWEPGRGPWAVDLAAAPEWLIEAIDTLRLEAGGGSSGPQEHTRPEDVKNAFGQQTDDREHKLQAMVWGAVVDLYRESPIPPTDELQEAEILRLWSQYELTTKTRLSGSQYDGMSNADLLEREGRGISELRRKWSYAMRRWTGKVKAAAAEPRPGGTGEGVKGEGGYQSGTAEGGFYHKEKHGAGDQDPEPVDVGTFAGDPPARGWLVTDWIVEGVVNSLYGPGGTGKSLLAQQLAYASITGGPWLGLAVKQGGVLAVFCEDDLDELHRRHEAIRKASGHVIGNPYGGALVWPRIGARNVLVSWRREGPSLGIFHERLKATLADLSPSLLILDTIADVFAGDECDRAQVNFFLKEVLGGLIRAQAEQGHKLTILILGHPSISGRQTGGSGFSGSTAWENGVRSRLYLSKPETGGQDERLLTRGKANYAASGEETGLKLVWAEGAFQACGTADISALQHAKRRIVERVEWAWKTGSPYMERRSHSRNLYGMLGQELGREGFDRSVVLQAIAEAIEEGLIKLSSNTGKRGWRTASE